MAQKSENKSTVKNEGSDEGNKVPEKSGPTAPGNDAGKTVKLDAALDVITGEMPEVTKAADSIAQKSLLKKEEENPTGAVKRGRGRPKGSKSKKSQVGGVVETPTELESQRRATAEFIVQITEMGGVALAGEAEGIMGESEKNMHAATWDRYLASKDIADIPPGVMVCMVMTQYYTRVLSTKKAQPKVEKALFWLKSKVGNLKNARIMRWDDRKRKNDTREEAGSEVRAGGDEEPRT